MSKKKKLGKMVLASTIALSGGGVLLPFTQAPVYAEENVEISYKEQAERFLQSAIGGDWDTVHSLLGKNLEAVTKEMLQSFWSGFTAPYGKIQDTSLIEVKNNKVHTKVTFLMKAEAGSYEFILKLDEEGKVDDFSTAAYNPPEYFLNPDYNHPENYVEKEVTIGEGVFSLPGILTVPKGDGPFPVVVLVHGSGPNDMDETVNVFKPFRDIAVGLANEGIAVLRYDKRTNVHPIKSTLNPTFSIQEETVIDANLAVEKLKSLPQVDSENIFVFGHSQGAYALPLIFENDKSGDIKGGIGVAGPSGKFQDLLLWQIEQQVSRAEKMGAPAEQIKALKENLAFYQEQIGIINNPDITLETLPAYYQFGTPYWWFEIRDYVPTVLAKKQDVPLLLLQGGKDLQVPVSHFEDWKSELTGRGNVQYKLYPDMFHFLVNYEGEPNLMTEYMTPGNVPQEFISDISQWVKTGKVDTKIDLGIFTDFKKNQYWSDAFTWAVNEGLIKGYPNNLLKPDHTILESHLLNVLFRYSLVDQFRDETTEAVYKLAAEMGLKVSSKPNAPMKRGETAVLIVRSITKKDMSEKEAVEWLYDLGIVNGYTDGDGQAPKNYQSFKPKEELSRAHLVTMLYRMAQMK